MRTELQRQVQTEPRKDVPVVLILVAAYAGPALPPQPVLASEADALGERLVAG